MGKTKVTEFVKNHKKEITIGAISAMGVGIAILFGTRVSKAMKITKSNASTIGNINTIDTWGVCTMTDLWTEGTWTSTIINNITIADLGKIGEELMKNIPSLTKDVSINHLNANFNIVKK